MRIDLGLRLLLHTKRLRFDKLKNKRLYYGKNIVAQNK